ncbi:peptidase M27 (plasmid) [Clostridium botulinum]|uniref:Peptidase M27 n=2 Tax=Clostridium botulinum TaxID=1491 RepID=A0A846I479_CLOBO|nr:non-toxic nonhemagglutinin NTNH [Clostridium botulinum]ACQ51274.1 botulinum neurotoxin type BvB, nontoxic-nonhemagglutinin component, NTNH [Clostridium botulinum Ba4 str. 657]AXG90502.1 peptidase M27 [Clostridium botulinum]NEZ92919.1 peptidase M27 [Clostridium botulinum]UYX45871.1 non-toxic nonhemagglutinin NTNH [Clostridium botulinum]BDB03764.1 nontoxic-nonhemagglutinin component, NTNH [Clostridium botulinum]
MNINDNLSINSPVDNKNVVVVRARKTDTVFKAFKVAPNIWVAPERYYGESLSIDEEYKVDGGIYDSNFLSQDSEKDKFLQAIITLLKRINSTNAGEKLLSLISTAIPFPYGYIGGGYYAPNMITFGSAPKSNKKLNSLISSTIPFPYAGYRETNYLSSEDNKSFYASNIVIFGPGANIVENNTVFYKKEDAENGMGTMTEIWFQPFLTYKYDEFYIDPAIELIKCLIKSLYFLYGIKPSDDLVIPYRLRSELENIEYSQLNIVDLLVSGGIDPKFINTDPYWFTDNYFSNAKKVFEDHRNIYETQIEGNNAIGNDIKLRLKQKFRININDIWELNLNYFSKEFSIMMPDRFNNALKHFYRKQYYKIDYPENYSINGFVNGQINVQLSLSDRNQDIINKPEEIINLLNGNNVSLMRSNIYGDGLKSTVDDFYSNYKIPYNRAYEYHFNNSNDSSLDNVNIGVIDNIPEIIDVNPYKENCDKFSPVQKITSTREINTNIPWPINYLQAQNTNNEKFSLSSDFVEVVSSKDKSLVYSFLSNVMFYLDSIKDNSPIDTDKKYYLWLREIFRNYSFDITATQEINTDCGINKVVTWFGKALNILNTSDSFVEEFQNLGPISLINKKENLSMPIIEIYGIPNDMLGLPLNDLNEKLFNIYLKNILYFKKVYFNFLDQWWTEYYSQYFDLICMAKQSILAQEKLIKQIIQNKLQDLFKADISMDKLNLMNLATEKTFIDLSNESQIAINNINDFLNKSAICVFDTNIYPKFISFMEQCINSVNSNVTAFIQKCTNITEDEKLQLIKLNTFMNIDFEFFDIQSIKDLITSETDLIKEEKESDYNLFLFTLQEDNNKVIEDISGKNTLVKYSDSISLVYGVNGDALYLKEPDESVSFSNKAFENGLTNSFSICFWLRNLGEDIITSKLIENKADNCGWEIYFENNGLVFSIVDCNGNEENIYLSDVISKNWYYISISIDRLRNQLLIFINDKLIANQSIEQILNIYSSNTISLVNENNPIYIEGLSILNRSITSEEVVNNYFSYLNNSYIRDISGERLEYNKTYELYNYVFPENSLYEVTENNNIYLSIKDTNNLNIQGAKFKLINIDANKQYVQKWDEGVVCLLGDEEKYVDISSENNRIQLVSSKDTAKRIIFNNDIFRPNCLTFAYNNKYLSLSLRDRNYNWMICNNNDNIPKAAHLWALKGI